MALFGKTNIDWLGKKWDFLSFSLIFSVAGLLSLLFWHHLPLDVDFKGGTVVRIRFAGQPDLRRLRQAADAAGLRDARIQSYGATSSNEVLITLAQGSARESSRQGGISIWIMPDAARLRPSSSRQTPSTSRPAMTQMPSIWGRRKPFWPSRTRRTAACFLQSKASEAWPMPRLRPH